MFIVDDDRIQLEILTALLESAHYAVQTFINPDEFLLAYQTDKPGCVISDILMPGMSGLEMQDVFHEKNIILPIIFMSAHGDIATVKIALKKGGVDFLEKPVNTVEILDAVEKALKRDKDIRNRRLQIDSLHARLDQLTRREREVLDSLIAGQTNRGLAEKLNLSLRTIETHRSNMLKKMGVHSFSHLLRLLLSSFEDISR